MLKAAEPATRPTAVSGGELDELFAPVAGEAGIGLAVSGGADSAALMVLAARWAERREFAPNLIVLTVDHGLRAAAADESQQVASQAAALGLRHETLVWKGEKPVADIQATARAARYRLLATRARELGLGVVLTGHHLDDQAETFMLRLARGSGAYGLAAMPAERLIDGVRLMRPLLPVPRARLEATLRQAGLSWIDDPSNRDTRFARVRMRDLMPALAAEGLTAERLAATADRLRRAAAALDGEADKVIAAATVRHPGGFAGLAAPALTAVAEEIGLRIVVRLLQAVAGGGYAPRLERLEALYGDLAHRGCGAVAVKRTLSGVVVEERGGRFWFYREAGRAGATTLRLEPGETTVWDRRFDVGLAASADAGIAVGPLGDAGRRLLAADCRGDWPDAAAAMAPAAWRGAELHAVPAFGYAADGAETCRFSANWRYLDDRQSTPAAGGQ